MSNDETRRVEAAKWSRYMTAKTAKSRWEAEEKAAKQDLLNALGYEPDDDKPVPVEVYSLDGTHLGAVHVGNRKGLDMTYLRNTHPDIYAECEKWSHPLSVRAPK
jgi:hypothetical protein